MVSHSVDRAVVTAAQPAPTTSFVASHQLVVSYLPALPGWFATRDLIRRDYL